MAELEVRVVSERRDGLLLELGRVVNEYGHVLVRQRWLQEEQGACLTLVLRGPPDRQPALEEALGLHPRVLRFESTRSLPAGHAVDSVAAAMVAEPVAHAAGSAGSSDAGPSLPSGADVARVERMLPGLAKDYPRIFPWLINLEYAVSAEVRDASLYLAGKRTGSWIFKRDFSLGARLALVDAIRRIALPALRVLVTVEQHEHQLHVRGCPLCQPGAPSGGRFFTGFLEGLLAESADTPHVVVRETRCHSLGAPVCVFDVSP
ncbi:4-vinyl reductase [Dyella sp. EPa41]|uniref:4-vinyl reductase n=1 Tax=Dyella sp. EPa41 TaxID=1561194 RepID=UPI001915D083|nr:4-vinyl reductase [Dyella sp. EPa41]